MGGAWFWYLLYDPRLDQEGQMCGEYCCLAVELVLQHGLQFSFLQKMWVWQKKILVGHTSVARFVGDSPVLMQELFQD